MATGRRTAGLAGAAARRRRGAQGEQLQAVAWGLAEPILHGRLRPGDRLPTVRTLMERHGAASQTVQKAFALLKRQGLIETGVGSGSFVAPRPLCGRRVALAYPWHPESLHRWSLFYDAAIAGVAAVERESDWQVPVFLGLDEAMPAMSDLGRLRQAIADIELGGLVFGEHPFMLAGSGLTAPDFPLPRVAIMRRDPKLPHIPALFFDFMSFFRRAFERIREAGRRRVGVVLGSNYSRDHIAIVNHHLAAFGLAGAPWLIQAVPQDEPAWASNAVQGMLSHCGSQRPDALVIIDDLLVVPALEGCRAAGACIGEDLTVLAYCNFPAKAKQQSGVDFLGLDGSELIATALHLIRRQQQGLAVPPLTLVPARFEREVAADEPAVVRQALAGERPPPARVAVDEPAFEPEACP